MLFGRKKRFSDHDLTSLIQACLADEKRAQRILIEQFVGYARSICQRYAAHEEETDEMLNDGFLKVFRHLAHYDPTQPFKAWLRTIMVNTAIDYYRKRQKQIAYTPLDEVNIIDWNEDIIAQISAQEILGLVQQLPPTYRLVFSLHVIDGYGHREIAELLGIQEGTSKSNLRDARRKLQAMIKRYYPHLYQMYTLPNQPLNEN